LYQAAVDAVAIDHPPSTRGMGLTTSRGYPENKSLSARKGVGLTPSSKKPNHVDQHVGRRLRLRRNLLDLSQDELAKHLGLTAQLIQKYEVGETRISASRLYDVAAQLAVPITWFFEELDQTSQPAISTERRLSERTPDWSDLVGKRESRQLLELYFGIPDQRLRRKVLEVAQLLQAGEAD
jgi:transcriptional regulator with XRE-family HTH domain